MGNGPNNPIGEYVYDGEGWGDKTIAGTEHTIFVYNADKQLVEENPRIAVTQAWPRLEVCLGKLRYGRLPPRCFISVD